MPRTHRWSRRTGPRRCSCRSDALVDDDQKAVLVRCTGQPDRADAQVIPEDVIAEIKRRADIGAVIGRSVKLTKRGRNLVGLCPFHTEKSPSFNVRPDEGFFYCFGCRAAGDVVEFLVKSTGRGFLDILSELAAETGVELPQVELSPAESAAQKERKRLLRVCELAQLFFRTRLQSDEGRSARAYLADARKLDDKAIDDFGLGFGGQGDQGLREFLGNQGIAVDDGVAAGVLGRGERGPYDFFRQRITIPIRSPRGDVVSFGGRIFGSAAEPRTLPDGSSRTPPKYLNGPQSSVYDKSNTLYGLFEAQPALKQGKPAVLVEGYFDAIAVHRAGLATAVAPCGTSLTPRHVDELKRRVGDGGRVVVCLDADRAGQEAAAKAVLMLLAADVDAGFVVLPDKDPDQMVQAGRVDELKGLLLGAPSALDHLVARAQEKATGSMQARVVAIDALLPFLAAPARELVRKGAVRAAARVLGEEADVLEREVEQRGRKLLAQKLRGERIVDARRPSSSASSSSGSSSSALSSSALSSGSSSSGPSMSGPPRGGARDPGRRGGRDSVRGDEVDGDVRAVPARTRRPSTPLNDTEVQLAKIVLCHPELAPRVGLLTPSLKSGELTGFVERLVDALVRFHDVAPREALTKVAVAPRGQLVALADRVRLDGPDRVIGLTTAMSMLDAISRDLLERSALETRLGALQSMLSAADGRGDHDERKRLLTEQRAIVAALQGMDAGGPQPLALLVARTVEALPALEPPAPARQLPAPALHVVVDESAASPATEDGGQDSGAVREEPPWPGDPEDDEWSV
jgi:DNA primase